MKASVGDTIVLESERAAQHARRATVEEVLQEDPLRVRVRWEDGHESLLTPAAGSARVEPRPDSPAT